MELKFYIVSLLNSIRICSNRTFMELKCLNTLQSKHSITSSNRTFMELKLPYNVRARINN